MIKRRKEREACVSPLVNAIDITLSSGRNYRTQNFKQIKQEIIQYLSALFAADPNYNISDKII
jgi:hypothetical protein